MTEAEWMNCTDSLKMLRFLRNERGESQRKAGRRKLRLFACACVRGIWVLLRKEGSRQAVVTAEQVADGLASAQELAEAQHKARWASASEGAEIGKSPYWQSSEAAIHVAAKSFSDGDHLSVTHASHSAAFAWAQARTGYGQQKGYGETFDEAVKARLAVHAAWLRDIFNNPFQSVAVDPIWVTWNGDTVKHLAKEIYDDRAFDRLPILADALEEAGCADADILAHCRGGGDHVRGCWVLDLLLGKQ
jgi:hypothetical protein